MDTAPLCSLPRELPTGYLGTDLGLVKVVKTGEYDHDLFCTTVQLKEALLGLKRFAN